MKSISSQKCIVMVRNPLEVLPSLSNSLNLMSVVLEPERKANVVNPLWWHQFVQSYTKLIKAQFEKL